MEWSSNFRSFQKIKIFIHFSGSWSTCMGSKDYLFDLDGKRFWTLFLKCWMLGISRGSCGSPFQVTEASIWNTRGPIWVLSRHTDRFVERWDTWWGIRSRRYDGLLCSILPHCRSHWSSRTSWTHWHFWRAHPESSWWHIQDYYGEEIYRIPLFHLSLEMICFPILFHFISFTSSSWSQHAICWTFIECSQL
jgi:hypothetical protein